jgi:acetolactate synthase-1/2/3 large subunit
MRRSRRWRRSLPDGDAIVTVDAGAHRILLSQKLRVRRPLAACCNRPGSAPWPRPCRWRSAPRSTRPVAPVVAVMGDGGLEMTLGELATLRDQALPVTIVLFQDQSLALIALKQNAAGLASNGVTLGQTDFAGVATAFGGHGRTVETATALEAELAAARDRPGFTLIACRFDPDAYDQAF